MTKRKTSTTAYVVNIGLAKLSRLTRWKHYFTKETIYLARAFMEHGKDSISKYLLAALPSRLFISFLDTCFIPGMAYHFLFRKRLIEQQVEQAIKTGTTQIIILGGGLDSLALRMAYRYADVEFFELDLAHTQEQKRTILEKIGYIVPGNCHLIETDLAEVPLEEALSLTSFRAEASTLIVLEGVLMYLIESEVKSLFQRMHALFTGPLQVIFGAIVSADSKGNLGLRVINYLLRKEQEATQWYCSSGQMPAFMHNLGFELKAWMPYRKLQEYYRLLEETRPLPREDENYYIVARMSPLPANISVSSIETTPFIPVKN